jgi:hypothetical protein
MNDTSSKHSAEISMRHDCPLHVAFTWLVVLSESIAVWACIS